MCKSDVTIYVRVVSHLESLLTAVRSIFGIDTIFETDGKTYVYGVSSGSIRPTKCLILLSDLADLNDRVTHNFNPTVKPARWMSKAAGIADLAGTLANNKNIEMTILVKVSPGSIVCTVPNSDDWTYLHLNDVIVQNGLGLPSIPTLLQGYHYSSLKEPLKSILESSNAKTVQPYLELPDKHSKLGAEETLISWCTNSEESFVILFGLGGLGKTTLIMSTCRALWKGFLSYEHSMVPTFVPLGNMPSGAYGLAPHIASFELFSKRLTASSIDALTKAGLLVVFLDAFDEHLKFATKAQATRLLQDLRETYSRTNAKIIITSRDYYLESDKIFDRILGPETSRFRLRALDSSQRREFIRLKLVSNHERTDLPRLSEEKALAWASALEEQVGALGQQGVQGIDQLVGHALFLLAFCDYVTQVEAGTIAPLTIESDANPLRPDEFKLRSDGLFDDVVRLITDREARDKSKWDVAIYGELQPEWHDNPFLSEKQTAFFAEITRRMVLEDNHRPSPSNLRPGMPPVERLVAESLTALKLVPQAKPTLEKQAREEVELEALSTIVEFYKNHPLVDGHGHGFDGETAFAFRHESYLDFFVKQYLVSRFSSAVGRLKTAGENISGAKELEDLVVELYYTKLLARASNAMYFLCWDDRALSKLRTGLRSLFVSEGITHLSPDIFSTVLQYSLLFVKLYQELRNKNVTFDGLFLHPGTNDEVIISGEDFNPLLNGITLSLCSMGHIRLSNTTFRDCHLIGVSIELLALEGTVTFEGGTLYLVPQDLPSGSEVTLEDSIYLANGECTVVLRNVTIHESTLAALEYVERTTGNLTIVREGLLVEDFEEESSDRLSPGRRFIDKLMSMMRKHGRPEFGVMARKVLGRTHVPRDRENEVLEVLENAGIIQNLDGFLTLKNETFMYHPKGLGRTWEAVSDMWEPLITEIDTIIQGYDAVSAG